MNEIKIAVLGGDGRQGFLINELSNCGYSVSSYGVVGKTDCECTSVSEALIDASVVILPFPVSPDGVYLNAVCDECNIKLSDLFDLIRKSRVKTIYGGGIKPSAYAHAKEMGLTLRDYGEIESVKIKNALCTVEGAIEIAMHELPINLSGSSCAVFGYGRIGSLLCKKLKALDSTVYAIARRNETLALAEAEGVIGVPLAYAKGILGACDVIFNTVPAGIIDADMLSALKNDCTVIDLASSPGGVDFKKARELDLNVIWALSLPGKCSPKSAAKIICQAVTDMMRADMLKERL